MATINITYPTAAIGAATMRYPVWLAMANGDAGQALDLLDYADHSVDVSGTWGSGGTLVWEGHNGSGTFKTLKDSSGTNMSFTANSLSQALTLARYVRPRVTAGDGTTSLNVYVVARNGGMS